MMFKLIPAIAAALVMPAALVWGMPPPAAAVIEARENDLSPNALVCTDLTSTSGCVTITISSDACINFTGGLGFLNKEVTKAVIPGGFVCTFFEQFGCQSAQGGKDAVVLQGGTWNFLQVPGVGGTVNFNDISSSFNCSPV